jgi:polyisoprenoid-binding protein YceI
LLVCRSLYKVFTASVPSASSEWEEETPVKNLKTALLACALAAMVGSVAAQTAKPASMIDTQRSTLTIKVFKSGVFSFAGDDHEVRAPITSGSVNEQEQIVALTVDAGKMEVLDPKLRPEKRAEVQKKMLSGDVLDSEHFPQIEFHSTKVEKKGDDELVVKGELTLHGTTRPVVVKVTGKAPNYKGSSTFKQTEFGMKPVSVGGGTVKVKDEVTIEFEIFTR